MSLLKKKDNLTEGLTPRQVEILRIIVDIYITTANPVGSLFISENYMPNVSSQTIRNEMAILEKKGYLEKKHTSSGRIPSTKGYHFFNKNIITQPSLNNEIKIRLYQILENRSKNIDDIIKESVTIISDLINLPSIVIDESINDRLKRLELIELDDNLALLILVTHCGQINKANIKFDNNSILTDMQICIEVLNDRLIDTPICQLIPKLNELSSILNQQVKAYESVIKNIFEKLFSDTNVIKSDIIGINNLATQPEFLDQEKLNAVLKLLEDSSVWKQIEYQHQKTGKTIITYGEQFNNPNLAIASSNINISNNLSKNIAIVGPKRMDYERVKALLDFVKEQLENLYGIK